MMEKNIREQINRGLFRVTGLFGECGNPSRFSLHDPTPDRDNRQNQESFGGLGINE
jgi:hypothetical protein